MKTIKFLIGMLLPFFILNGCSNDPDPELWEYQSIIFSFQDASGKDLVREALEPLLVYEGDNEYLTFSENFYRLKVIYPEPCMDPVKRAIKQLYEHDPRAYYEDPDNIWCTPMFYYFDDREIWELSFRPETCDDCAKAKMLTLLVQSPIFGDEQEHEFVLHFDGLKISRILMDEKECSFIQKKWLDNGSITKRNSLGIFEAEVAYCSIVL